MVTLDMSVDVLSIKDFNDKVKSYIPIHEVSIRPRLGDVEGQSFECGCGSSHILNFEKHYLISDGGMFKAIFLSPDCGFLNALKLKKMFSKGIENLCSTKFLVNEINYGFESYPDVSGAINQYLDYFKK
ncbi:hypothetical protein N9E71_02415 [Candidatus Pelagibacter sp.]|jgi:hypothetical protein|nr:hypothetical protein [Candidatus Pelagibacter sp.]